MPHPGPDGDLGACAGAASSCKYAAPAISIYAEEVGVEGQAARDGGLHVLVPPRRTRRTVLPIGAVASGRTQKPQLVSTASLRSSRRPLVDSEALTRGETSLDKK